MSSHQIEDRDRAVWKRLEDFGLRERPLHDPLGDGHHTDMPFTEEDKRLGDDLAWFMGTMDWLESSVEQWRRVVRALRVHGIRLVNANIRKGEL